MVKLTLAAPWRDPEGVRHVVGDQIVVDHRQARKLIGDGTARPAEPVEEAVSEQSGDDQSGDDHG